MVTYDTTQIALFVSLVLTVAVVGIVVAAGLAASALSHRRPARSTRPQTRRGHAGRLAFHH